jgi:hypothetical protein
MSRAARLESILAGGVLVAALAVVGTVPVEAQAPRFAGGAGHPSPLENRSEGYPAPPATRAAPVLGPVEDDVDWGPVVVDPAPTDPPVAPAPRSGTPQAPGGDDRTPLPPPPRESPLSGGSTAPPPVSAPDAASNAGFFEALPGPSVAQGVPNFVIRKFRVPLFLLPIYQAAGIEYGIRWEILAAINEIETDYGRNLNVSSAGALGWMQFMPSSWKAYGVDANKDGRKDPYNPVDAIFAAARYLKAANYDNDVRGAIFAYNHADWYVDSVMLRARLISGVPADLVGSLTGLTEGRFPVAARARYADDRLYARAGSPVVAVNDGIVKRVSESDRHGDEIAIQDVYGNRYTYSGLGEIASQSGISEGVQSATGQLVFGKERLHAHPGMAKRSPRRLKVGSRVIGGTIVGRIGKVDPDKAAHLDFAIRPAGKGAPSIDPKPILDGWKLLEATAIHRPASIGQILLLPKPLLEKRVLADERIVIYEDGRSDIQSGQIDRRVLASLAYLAESGLRPTVTSLKSGHSYLTASGNVSHHSSGNAADVAQVNGVPILGHQEPGGVTDQAVRRLMRLQGTMRPSQIISLLDYGQNTMAIADHADHIHIGFQPLFGQNRKLGQQALAVLEPGQWSDLIARLREIDNPVVPTEPSKYSLPAD